MYKAATSTTLRTSSVSSMDADRASRDGVNSPIDFTQMMTVPLKNKNIYKSADQLLLLKTSPNHFPQRTILPSDTVLCASKQNRFAHSNAANWFTGTSSLSTDGIRSHSSTRSVENLVNDQMIILNHQLRAKTSSLEHNEFTLKTEHTRFNGIEDDLNEDNRELNSGIIKEADLKNRKSNHDNIHPTPINMMPPMQQQSQSTSVGNADSHGLIVPKKLANPCLESSDRKNLHRELMFNQKIGKNVLNQKSELQKALQKQKERQIIHAETQRQQQQHDQGLTGELGRVIMQRAQRIESLHSGGENHHHDEADNQLNPEYLNARAKLRATVDMK